MVHYVFQVVFFPTSSSKKKESYWPKTWVKLLLRNPSLQIRIVFGHRNSHKNKTYYLLSLKFLQGWKIDIHCIFSQVRLGFLIFFRSIVEYTPKILPNDFMFGSYSDWGWSTSICQSQNPCDIPLYCLVNYEIIPKKNHPHFEASNIEGRSLVPVDPPTRLSQRPISPESCREHGSPWSRLQCFAAFPPLHDGHSVTAPTVSKNRVIELWCKFLVFSWETFSWVSYINIRVTFDLHVLIAFHETRPESKFKKTRLQNQIQSKYSINTASLLKFQWLHIL